MAQGRRVERVAALIRREMSELLRHGIKDQRVQLGMVSVTDVQVAGDLQHCRVYVSIFGSDDDRSQAMAGLASAAPYVKGELARRLQLRRTPEVVFALDRALERGTSVLGLLHKLEQQRDQRGEIPAGSDATVDGLADDALKVGDPTPSERSDSERSGSGHSDSEYSDSDMTVGTARVSGTRPNGSPTLDATG